MDSVPLHSNAAKVLVARSEDSTIPCVHFDPSEEEKIAKDAIAPSIGTIDCYTPSRHRGQPQMYHVKKGWKKSLSDPELIRLHESWALKAALELNQEVYEWTGSFASCMNTFFVEGREERCDGTTNGAQLIESSH